MQINKIEYKLLKLLSGLKEGELDHLLPALSELKISIFRHYVMFDLGLDLRVGLKLKGESVLLGNE